MPRLWDRIWKRSPAVAPICLTIYSRAGCGCCLKALDVLESFRGRYPLRIEVVDVDGSEDLKERFGMEVPVVMLDGKVRFRGLINPTMLDRLLKAASVEADREGDGRPTSGDRTGGGGGDDQV